jgi:opacity protein-like surface antigen
MRKLLVPAAAAAILATSAVAFAAVQHTDGTIKTFDAKAMSLTLNDGTAFVLSKKFKDPGLKVGEKVSVMWDMSGTNKVAESVKIVK